MSNTQDATIALKKRMKKKNGGAAARAAGGDMRRVQVAGDFKHAVDVCDDGEEGEGAGACEESEVRPKTKKELANSAANQERDAAAGGGGGGGGDIRGVVATASNKRSKKKKSKSLYWPAEAEALLQPTPQELNGADESGEAAESSAGSERLAEQSKTHSTHWLVSALDTVVSDCLTCFCVVLLFSFFVLLVYPVFPLRLRPGSNLNQILALDIRQLVPDNVLKVFGGGRGTREGTTGKGRRFEKN
jgi:hypothetical protein